MIHQFVLVMVLVLDQMFVNAMMDGWEMIVLSLIASVSHPISHLFVLARASASSRTIVCVMMASGDTSVRDSNNHLYHGTRSS